MAIIEPRQQLLASRQLQISCVVPVHNEEGAIVDFINALKKQLQDLNDNFEIIIVDDGSKDNTLPKIITLLDQHIKLIALSRNFGQENALVAGMEHSSGDVVILIDADFQHPIELIPTFLQHWINDYDIVYGIRQNREQESFVKRFLTHGFYRFLGKISRIDIPPNAGYFRLLDRKAVDALNTLQERSRFLRGLSSWIGFKSIGIPFKVKQRTTGRSSWSFYRLTELALTGITSFSDIPLRVWSLVGFVVAGIAFAYGLYIVTKTLIFGVDTPGFATIIVAIMFFGGIQIFSIGVLGEYIARIFNEVKRRPNYIIAKKFGFDD